ncbi:MAG: glycosyltransferase [Lachnospiraceae bacterium]|nr:glycosyltransferase [Lachnospiraceae bacterium]
MKEKQELITAIITTYKRHPEMVLRALTSVIVQTYQNLEIIVVDDSPASFLRRDEVARCVKNVGDKRVQYIQHKKNRGACAARNTGIRISQGAYIAFLDDDDIWYSEKIQKQYEYIQQSGFAMVYCNYNIINEKKGKKEIAGMKRYSGHIFRPLLKENFVGSTSFPLIKRECFQSCGLFDENLKASQDYDMWLKIAQKYKIGYMEEPLADYVIHAGETITGNISNRIQGAETLNQNYRAFLKKEPKIFGYRLARLAAMYIRAEQKEKAFESYKKAVRLAPFNIKRNSMTLLLFFLYLIGMKV